MARQSERVDRNVYVTTASNWLAGILLFSTMMSAAQADVRTRYGAVIASDVSFEIAGTSTWQYADDVRIEDEALLSVDLVAHRKLREGQLTLYVEANSSPRGGGVSSLIAEANGDAASALDDRGRGRFQVSELHYTCVRMTDCFSAGLIDPSAFADVSRIANDESSQFLNTGFVNNPAIAFPDYTLGLVVHQDYTGTLPGYTWLLSLSHGLADNPQRSYSELLDVSASGKGVFSLLEAYGAAWGGMARAGAWISTADHDRLDDSSGKDENYGVYTVLDNSVGDLLWSFRLGLANPEVSEITGFVSLAFQYPVDEHTVGLAIGTSRLSTRVTDPSRDDRHSAELYVRFQPAEGFSLSPSVQYIDNSGLNTDDVRFDNPVTVYSLRGSYIF